MQIEKIRLFNFRNYEETTVRLDPGINIFYGKNGSGKTNILEAVHFCAIGKSHRTGVDHEAIMNGKTESSCETTVKDIYNKYDIAVRFKRGQNTKKEIQINGVKLSRLSELMGKLPSVMFSPEDLGIIREGPSSRRKFINILICQLRPDYFIALQQYQTALEQRNAILRKIKNNIYYDNSVLESFEEILAEKAGIIIPLREKYISAVSETSKETYRRISGNNENFSIVYKSELCNTESIEEEMKRRLRNGRENEIRNGCTLFGPHRDDLVMQLGNNAMKAYASQGQTRTASLSLKISQLKIYEKETKTTPLLMLDDVMSELDKERKKNLIDEISKVQTMITCTDINEISLPYEYRSFNVTKTEEKGNIREIYSESLNNKNVSRETLQSGNEEYFFL